MSNDTPKIPKITVDAPVTSQPIPEPSVAEAEAALPSFMMAQTGVPPEFNAAIEQTAASMVHTAPQQVEPEPTQAPEPILNPEITDRTQPVFSQPAFDAQASLEAAAAEEFAPVFPDVAQVAPETPVSQAPVTPEPITVSPVVEPTVEPEPYVHAAPQPARPHYVEPAPFEPKPMVTDFAPVANDNVSQKYVFGGIAAAITVLSLGLFVLPYNDKAQDEPQTIAMIEQPSETVDADIQPVETAAVDLQADEPVALDVELTNQELAESTSGALSELGVIINQRSSSTPTLSFVDEAALSGNTLVPLMRDVTQQIISDADTIAPTQDLPQAQEETDLANMIAEAISTDQSNAVLRAIITDAIQNNQMTVPRALVNSNGDIDTASLIAALVQFSAEGSATDPGYELPPQRTFSNGDTLEHLVVQGESLASISLRYYGNTFDYPRIFAANTDKLASPDKIRIGQRLVIPQ